MAGSVKHGIVAIGVGRTFDYFFKTSYVIPNGFEYHRNIPVDEHGRRGFFGENMFTSEHYYAIVRIKDESAKSEVRIDSVDFP